MILKSLDFLCEASTGYGGNLENQSTAVITNTNDGTINMSGYFTNNGTVTNDGTVNISGGSYVNNGTWNGNEPVGGV